MASLNTFNKEWAKATSNVSNVFATTSSTTSGGTYTYTWGEINAADTTWFQPIVSNPQPPSPFIGNEQLTQGDIKNLKEKVAKVDKLEQRIKRLEQLIRDVSRVELE
ncbi:MAG: hypothetical protein HY376_02045 [Candidatus Blackburnbacteria bacterium]|nr:hypothetical protein [Candidatus Blackburnbacteria bacterium]